MSIFESIILGIVEGLTEFLPISSTAHLVITANWLAIPHSDFLSSFIIAIQLGAILSVALLYARRLWIDHEMLLNVVIAFIPTGVIGFALYKLLKSFLIENIPLIASMLILGGVVLILFDYFWKGEEGEARAITNKEAFIIGCVQSIAIIPGVSRAGATIVGGLLLGVNKREIVEFSFLLAIPTMLAATGYDLLKTGSSFAASEWHLLLIGFVVSAIAAYAGVRFFISYVQSHGFALFGWYRVALGALVLILLLQ